MSHSLYEVPLEHLDGEAATLADYQGRVLLIVNVASKCGLTPQSAPRHALYARLIAAQPTARPMLVAELESALG